MLSYLLFLLRFILNFLVNSKILYNFASSNNE
nr:MAG TPA: hypothetical protein [Caudoviricetes sp.]